MPSLDYVGSELEIFAHAHNWKAYWSGIIRHYVQGDVLDVGAGLGATALCLAAGHAGSWTCLEPDAALAAQLAAAQQAGQVPSKCSVIVGTLDDLPVVKSYDTILYIDVLEHIEDDRTELAKALPLLREGGHLIVLSPAHQSLFSEFDKAIGHFRRYSRQTLQSAAPRQMHTVTLRYLDCLGMFLSMSNRLLLKQSQPTIAQIGVWDRFIVPVSRWIDPLLGFRAGKSILGVWRAGDSGSSDAR